MYFNPRSPRGERRRYFLINASAPGISIHAPLAGSDQQHSHLSLLTSYFNPRSPRGERRPGAACSTISGPFQSTLPSRGATVFRLSSSMLSSKFQSTLPSRGATGNALDFAAASSHFNPRSPRGERRSEERGRDGGDGFQSTLPSRGATASLLLAINPMQFQSTLPSRGATPMSIMRSIRFKNFNPRSPRGERRYSDCPPPCCHRNFNPRSPRGERPHRSLSYL